MSVPTDGLAWQRRARSDRSSLALPHEPCRVAHSPPPNYHQLLTANQACLQLQVGRCAPLQPHALGAETRCRHARSRSPSGCRIHTTPCPTNRPLYSSEFFCLVLKRHARQRSTAARARRRWRARPVRPDDSRAADGGRQPRRAPKAVRLL